VGCEADSGFFAYRREAEFGMILMRAVLSVTRDHVWTKKLEYGEF
jgi:hypothetical protein